MQLLYTGHSETRFLKYVYDFSCSRSAAGNAFRWNNCPVDGGELLFSDGATSTGADRLVIAPVAVAAAIALFQRFQTQRSVPATVHRRTSATVQRRAATTVYRRTGSAVLQRTVRADLTAVVRHLPRRQLHFQVSHCGFRWYFLPYLIL